jgi:hypothetical protein
MAPSTQSGRTDILEDDLRIFLKKGYHSVIRLSSKLFTQEIHYDNKLLFVQILFFVLIFSAAFYLFFNQVFGTIHGVSGADLRKHIDFTSQYFAGEKYIPHPGIHTICHTFSKISGLSLKYSFVLVLSLFVTAIAFIIYVALLKFLKENYSPSFLLFVTAVLMLLSAIYVPFFNPMLFLLQGGPNVWHNPTAIAVKPFALLSVIIMVSFYQEIKNQKRIGYYLLAASILLLSIWIKPNFALSFLPAIVIWILIRHTKRWDLYLKSLLLFLPSLIYLFIQFLKTFNTPDASKIVVDYLGVWKLYSPNPYISLLLGTCFPVLLIIFRFKKVMTDPFFLACFINLVVAVLQLMFFAESPRYKHGNFGWGYIIALQLIFVFAVIEYFKWIRIGRMRSIELVKIIIVSVAFGLHFSSGIFYTLKIWSGGGWV